jgi:hypothetical protein
MGTGNGVPSHRTAYSVRATNQHAGIAGLGGGAVIFAGCIGLSTSLLMDGYNNVFIPLKEWETGIIVLFPELDWDTEF